MDKRVLIFSHYRDVQEKVGELIKDYFLENFADTSYGMRVQKFPNIPESVKEKCELGLGGEILIIFDEHPAPPSLHKSYFNLTREEKLRLDLLKHQSQMHQKLCGSLNIPYFVYSGEISKEKEYTLRSKLEKLKPDIERRLARLDEISW